MRSFIRNAENTTGDYQGIGVGGGIVGRQSRQHRQAVGRRRVVNEGGQFVCVRDFLIRIFILTICFFLSPWAGRLAECPASRTKKSREG
jgi:hypothetical protein